MKRANEHAAPPCRGPLAAEPESSRRTGQPPPAASASTRPTAASPPGVVSTSNRTGAAMARDPSPFMYRHPAQIVPPWHAPAPPSPLQFARPIADRGGAAAGMMPAPPGAAPRQPGAIPESPAAHPESRDVFQDKALLARVKDMIPADLSLWLRTALVLKGQEQTDFLVASLDQVVRRLGEAPVWQKPLHFIMNRVRMDVLLAQKWPDGRGLVSLLAGIKANQWLDRALAHEAGRLSLFVKDKSGAAPLNFAVLAGNKKAVRRILACDDDAGTLRMSQNDQKIIALHDACIAMNEAIVGLLLERKGREQRLCAYHGGFLPIHGALVIGTGAGALPRLLAECAEEQTLAQTTTGINALMLAAAAGSASGVAALLAVKGTLVRQLVARDGRGRTAIDHARNGGNADVVGLIETAMKSLPSAPSSTTASLATRATATPAVACPGNDMPVPLTPCPPTPSAREDAGASDTEDEPQGE